jgi:DNA-binding protein
MNNEFKGSIGTWSIADNNIITSDEQDICTVNIYLDAYMDNENARQEVICKANAQLISKAPQMLEMLKQVVVLFESNKLRSVHGIKELINEATTI